MPRVWLAVDNNGHMSACEWEHPDGMPVDMNASVLRQIRAANKQYRKFQALLTDMYTEAVEHPDTVRRVR